MSTKTLDDCTRDDLGELAHAAVDLLAMAMFTYWENEGEKDDDPSQRDAIERMRAALERCGLPQATCEEYTRRMEAVLELPPEEFVRRFNAGREG